MQVIGKNVNASALLRDNMLKCSVNNKQGHVANNRDTTFLTNRAGSADGSRDKISLHMQDTDFDEKYMTGLNG